MRTGARAQKAPTATLVPVMLVSLEAAAEFQMRRVETCVLRVEMARWTVVKRE